MPASDPFGPVRLVAGLAGGHSGRTSSKQSREADRCAPIVVRPDLPPVRRARLLSDFWHPAGVRARRARFPAAVFAGGPSGRAALAATAGAPRSLASGLLRFSF